MLFAGYKKEHFMKTYDKRLLKNVQKIDMEMALFFVDFCDKNQLLCYFCGGGCIGAVRHKGFIPWDDDLDFFMPREDYELMKQLWVDTDKYALQYPTEKYNDHSMFATLRDKKTTMIKPFQQGMDIVHGISLDIFPLDGYPTGKVKRMLQVFWALIYQLYCAQLIPENHGRAATLIGCIGLKLVRNKKARYRIWKYAEKQMSKYLISECDYITEICAGPYYMKNKYPKELFERAIRVQFEGAMMPIPIGYDQYLKMAFGNYMEYPPQNKQIPSHDAIVVDTEKPYTEYRAIYMKNK